MVGNPLVCGTEVLNRGFLWKEAGAVGVETRSIADALVLSGFMG